MPVHEGFVGSVAACKSTCGTGAMFLNYDGNEVQRLDGTEVGSCVPFAEYLPIRFPVLVGAGHPRVGPTQGRLLHP